MNKGERRTFCFLLWSSPVDLFQWIILYCITTGRFKIWMISKSALNRDYLTNNSHTLQCSLHILFRCDPLLRPYNTSTSRLPVFDKLIYSSLSDSYRILVRFCHSIFSSHNQMNIVKCHVCIISIASDFLVTREPPKSQLLFSTFMKPRKVAYYDQFHVKETKKYAKMAISQELLQIETWNWCQNVGKGHFYIQLQYIIRA